MENVIANILVDEIEELYKELDSLYSQFATIFGYAYLSPATNCRIYIPDYIIKIMEIYTARNILQGGSHKIETFRGIPVVPNWDNSIVLMHKNAMDYPEYKSGKSKAVLKMSGLFSDTYIIETV